MMLYLSIPNLTRISLHLIFAFIIYFLNVDITYAQELKSWTIYGVVYNVESRLPVSTIVYLNHHITTAPIDSSITHVGYYSLNNIFNKHIILNVNHPSYEDTTISITLEYPYQPIRIDIPLVPNDKYVHMQTSIIYSSILNSKPVRNIINKCNLIKRIFIQDQQCNMASIAGKIYSYDSKPVDNAIIMLLDRSNNILQLDNKYYITTTSNKGVFCMDNILPDLYGIRIQLDNQYYDIGEKWYLASGYLVVFIINHPYTMPTVCVYIKTSTEFRK